MYSRATSIVEDSSTVITPSRPTLSKAWAIKSPSFGSWAEIVATCAISSLPLTGFAKRCNSSVTAATAASIPRLIPIGLAPAAT